MELAPPSSRGVHPRGGVGDTLTADLGSVMTVRGEVVANHRAASTLVIVSVLARAEWMIEIRAVAAS